MTFVNKTITYLAKNGVIDNQMFFKPSFAIQHDQGVFGLFDDAQLSTVISLIDEVNANALVV